MLLKSTCKLWNNLTASSQFPCYPHRPRQEPKPSIEGWRLTSGLEVCGHDHSFLTEKLVSKLDLPSCLMNVLSSYPSPLPTTHCLTKALATKSEESGIQDEGTVYKVPWVVAKCGHWSQCLRITAEYSSKWKPDSQQSRRLPCKTGGLKLQSNRTGAC